jgi:biotin carboxyl carrier protein
MQEWKLVVDDNNIILTETEISSLQLLQTDSNAFHVIDDTEGFNIKIQTDERVSNKLFIDYGNTTYEVDVLDALQQQIAAMGLDKKEDTSVQFIKAPMPGLVLDIFVKEGDRLNKGDKLLVLEAMKMENVINVPADTVIKKVLVQKGTAVEKGVLLVELAAE